MTEDCDFVYLDVTATNRDFRIAHEYNKDYNDDCNRRMKQIRGGW